MPTEQIGLTAAAVAAVVALWRLLLEFIRELRTDRDYWRKLALSGTDLAGKALEKGTDRDA